MPDLSPLHPPLTTWYRHNARTLPWRNPDCDAWAVLVSEIMLQQTPVQRVVPVWQSWLERWPSPTALAADSPGEAVRMWGKLGYPRRALRLHAAAVECDSRFAGHVPDNYGDLRSLPGIGDYTAAAVLAFAYGKRALVLDTNVRRVLARVLDGTEFARPSVTTAERDRAEAVLPDNDTAAALWSIALMELGALVCTSSSPTCDMCPVAANCRWLAAGKPSYDGPARTVQRFAGTDRQVRGRLLDVVRGTDSAVPKSALDIVWPDAVQRERALDSLVSDGLLDPLPDGTYALPK
ncbi:MAG: A/G-specific adenine glycosylase [Actinomycetes bacterium]